MSANAKIDIRSLIQAGLAAFDRSDWDQATRAFEEARSADPSHPLPCLFLSLTYFAAGNLEQSHSLLQGETKTPENALQKNLEALHALEQKQFETAFQLLRRVGLMEHPRIQALFLLEIEKKLMELE